MPARHAQLQGVGSRPVDDRIRGRIQSGVTRRGWGRDKCLGQCEGKVGRLGVPETRDERQKWHARSGRTGHNSGCNLSRSRLCMS